MEQTVIEERRVTRLNALLRAVGFERSFVLLEDLPIGLDGMSGWINNDHSATIARRLTDVEAEATTLHEAAHWRLGHEDELAPDYEAARRADEREARDHHRAVFEQAANHLAAEWIEELRGSGLLTDPDVSLRFLVEDDGKFT